MNSKGRIQGRVHPYTDTIPYLHRPTESNLNKPQTYEEKIYCHFFWIEAILNPALTRKVLDELEYLPEFNAHWGKHSKEARKSKDRTFELAKRDPKENKMIPLERAKRKKRS